LKSLGGFQLIVNLLSPQKKC